MSFMEYTLARIAERMGLNTDRFIGNFYLIVLSLCVCAFVWMLKKGIV